MGQLAAHMKRIWKVVIEYAWLVMFAVLVIPALPHNGDAQLEVTPNVRFGIVAPWVREYLSEEWDRHQFDNPYYERGYCGYFEMGQFAGEPAWIITRVTRPDMIVGTPTTTGIDFRCYAFNAVPIHVHPPRNCETKWFPCTADGFYAYQCLPSDADRYMLTYYGYPWGVVQCERKGLRTFWPLGVAGT